MLEVALAAMLLSAAPAKSKRGAAAQADSVRPTDLLQSREKDVQWRPGTLLRLDVTLDGVPDAAVLGTAADGSAAVLAVIQGPITQDSKHWVLQFPRRRALNPEMALCGDADKASMKPERLVPPVDNIGCDVPDPGPDCEPVLKLNQQLVEAAKNGSQAINLKPGPCDPFHVYFDPNQSSLQWWRM